MILLLSKYLIKFMLIEIISVIPFIIYIFLIALHYLKCLIHFCIVRINQRTIIRIPLRLLFTTATNIIIQPTHRILIPILTLLISPIISALIIRSVISIISPILWFCKSWFYLLDYWFAEWGASACSVGGEDSWGSTGVIGDHELWLEGVMICSSGFFIGVVVIFGG